MSTGLSERQLLCLFMHTTLSLGDAVGLRDTKSLCSALRRHNICMDNVHAAGLRIKDMHALGIDSLQQFKRLRLDALHLTDPMIATEMLELFGATAVVDEFVCTAQDAVYIAGSEGARLLHITSDRLPECCAGCPEGPAKVIAAIANPEQTCAQTSVSRLCDTGIQRLALNASGISLLTLTNHFVLTRKEMQQLGFSVGLR